MGGSATRAGQPALVFQAPALKVRTEETVRKPDRSRTLGYAVWYALPALSDLAHQRHTRTRR